MSQNNQQNQNRSAISPSNEDLQKKIANSVTFHDNLGERILTIYESKLKLCLKDNMENMGSRTAWQAPAGVGLTLLLTCLTSDFQDWILSRYTWQAIFVIAGGLSFVWLVYTLIKMPGMKKVDDIVEELMPPQEVVINKSKKAGKN